MYAGEHPHVLAAADYSQLDCISWVKEGQKPDILIYIDFDTVVGLLWLILVFNVS